LPSPPPLNWWVSEGSIIIAEFVIRRDAEMVAEPLSREQGVGRTSVFIAAAGSNNSAGDWYSETAVGSGHPHTEADGDPELSEKVSVPVDFDADVAAADTTTAFTSVGASSISEK
jgi:hypothetical protein